MKCNKCGVENPDEAKFCLQCGNGLSDEESRSGGEEKVVDETPEKEFVKKDKDVTDKVLFYVKNGLALATLLLAFIGSFVIGVKINTYDSDDNLSIVTRLFIGNYDEIFSNRGFIKIMTMILQIVSIAATFGLLFAASLVFGIKKKSVSKYMFAGLLVYVLPVACGMANRLKSALVLSGATIAMLSLVFVFAAATFTLSCIRSGRKDKKSTLAKIFKGGALILTAVSVLSFGFYAYDGFLGDVGFLLYVTPGLTERALSIIAVILFFAGLFIAVTSGILKAFNKNVSSLVLSAIGVWLEITAFAFMKAGLSSGVSMSEPVAFGYVVGISVSLIACGMNAAHLGIVKNAERPDARTGGERVCFYLKNSVAIVIMLIAFAGTLVLGWKYNKQPHTLLGNYYYLYANALTLEILTIILHVSSIIITFSLLLAAALKFARKRTDVGKYANISMLVYIAAAAFFSAYFNQGAYLAKSFSGETIAMIVLAFVFVGMLSVVSCVEKASKGKLRVLTEAFKSATIVFAGISVLAFGFFAYKTSSTEGSVGVNVGLLSAYADLPVLDGFAGYGLALFIVGFASTISAGILKSTESNVLALIFSCLGMLLQAGAYVLVYYSRVVQIIAPYIAGIIISLIGFGLNITHVALKKRANKQGELLGKEEVAQ